MGRLIDADALIEQIKSHDDITLDRYSELAVVRMIREQPTAYDVEKVVAELDEQSIRVGIRGIDGNHDILSLLPTIEIVRKGSVE